MVQNQDYQRKSLGFLNNSQKQQQQKIRLKKKSRPIKKKVNKKKKQKKQKKASKIKSTQTNEICAIIVGIEYVRYAKQKKLDRLPGCHRDAFNMKNLLMSKYKINAADINMLLDLPGYVRPTTQNILKVLKTILLRSNYKNIFFIYSGHGSKTYAKNSSEPDQQNESLVSCDFLETGLLQDDTLRNYLAQYLNVNSNFIGIFDSCHSGSVLDLPKILKTGDSNFTIGDKTDYYSSKTGQIISLSACLDHQTATSAIINNQWQGALCHSLQKILQKDSFLPIEDLLNQLKIEVNKKLGFDQKTALSINNNQSNQIQFPYPT